MADNKIDLELMEHDESTRRLVIPAMGRLVLKYNPEFVVGVPNGGTWLAGTIAAEIGCAHIKLFKSDTGEIDYYRGDSVDYEVELQHLERGVLVEDVSRTFKSIRKTLASISALDARTEAVVAVLDRAAGRPDRQMPVQPFDPLIAENIPEFLRPPLEDPRVTSTGL